MRKAIFIFLLPVSGALYAYTNLGALNLGDPVYAPAAKASALGLTSYSSAKNASCVFFNAAAMASFKDTRIFMNLPMMSVSERVIPDSDWSADTGGAYYNEHFYLDVPDFAVAFPFSENVKLGAGVVKRQSFSYSHEKNTYEDSSYIGKLEYTGKGAITGYNFAVALKLGAVWSAGYAYEILSGKPTLESIRVRSSVNYEEKEELDFSGARNVFSLYEDKAMWNVSLTYMTSSAMDYDCKYTATVSTVSASLKYGGNLKFPRTLALGINHIWAGAVSASVYFDIVKTFWSDSSFTAAGGVVKLNYRNSVSYHLGIENDLTSRLQLRYGMAFIPSYERSSVERALITAGFGWYLSANMYFNFGYAYGRRNYIQNWEGGGISYSGRLDESMNIFNFSVDWKL